MGTTGTLQCGRPALGLTDGLVTWQVEPRKDVLHRMPRTSFHPSKTVFTPHPVLNLHCQGPNSSKRYSLPAPLHKQVSLGGHRQPQLSAPNVTSGHMKGLGS